MGKPKLTEDEVEKMTRQLLAEVAGGWPNTEDSYVLGEGGGYVFTFVMRREGGNTVVNYNPFEETKKIVRDTDFAVGDIGEHNAHLRPEVISASAIRRVKHMLDIARQHFEESLSQLQIIASTRVHLIMLQGVGHLELQKQYINAAAEMFDGRLREKLTEVLVDKLNGPHFKFSDFDAQTAIHELSERPSRRALARKLGVTPATVLNWAKRRGFKNLDELLDHLASQRAEIVRLAAEMKKKREGGNIWGPDIAQGNI